MSQKSRDIVAIAINSDIREYLTINSDMKYIFRSSRDAIVSYYIFFREIEYCSDYIFIRKHNR